MANIVKARLDATNKQIILEVVDDTTGAAVTSLGTVTLKLGADPGGAPAANTGIAMGKDIKLRETIGCDDAGDPQYAMVLRSEWYATALTNNPGT
jgi:hypothetical protein